MPRTRTKDKKNEVTHGEIHLRIPGTLLQEIRDRASSTRRPLNTEILVWLENSRERKA